MRTIFSLILVTAAFFVLVYLHSADIIGNDAKLYWRGTHLFVGGEVPYKTLPLWNPPWTFLIFTPLFIWGEAFSYIVLYTLNTILLCHMFAVCDCICGNKFSFKRVDFYLVVLLATPLLISISYNFALGQLGIILAYCLISSWAALQRKRYLVSALFLIPLLIKPHIGFVASFFIVVKILKEADARELLFAMIATSSVIIVSYVMSPETYHYWFSFNAIPTEWIGWTPINILREYLLYYEYYELFRSIAYLFALFGLIITIFFMRYSKVLRKTDGASFALLLILSHIFCPYGFALDMMPLYFAVFWICHILYKKSGNYAGVFLFSILSWTPLVLNLIHYRYTFTFYSVFLLIVWIYLYMTESWYFSSNERCSVNP